jgi:thiaminase/transcriptional activator TenA
MALSDRLREDSDAIWRLLHAHPFLRELAAGALPPEKFRFYLEQNLLYLPDYARAIALGAAKAADVEELGRFAAALVNIVDTEIPENRELLGQIVADGASDRGGGLAMAPATLAYTSYLLATAYRGGPLDIMTAILPCAWSYGEIAQALAGEVLDHPVYAGWVGFFASPSYAGLVMRMRSELDAMGEDVGPDRMAELETIFRMGGRLELAFWEMGYRCEQWADLGAPEGRAAR